MIGQVIKPDFLISRQPGSPRALTGNRVDLLRRCIDDDNYLHAAIQRLALVMSNELMEITTQGGRNERQRKKRK